MDAAIPSLRNGGKLSKNHYRRRLPLDVARRQGHTCTYLRNKAFSQNDVMLLPRSCGLAGRVDGHIKRTLARVVLAVKHCRSARYPGAVEQGWVLLAELHAFYYVSVCWACPRKQLRRS